MSQITTITSTPKDPVHKSESHKLHHAFVVGEDKTVHRGEMVQMVQGADAEVIEPAGENSNLGTIIGYSEMTGEAGDEVTIACNGYGIIWVEYMGTIEEAGQPVVADDWANGSSNYPRVTSPADPGETMDDVHQVIGWLLDTPAAAAEGQGSIVRMLIRG